MSKQQSEQLQNECQYVQSMLHITDDKWKQIFGTKDGLYGFVEAQLAKRDLNYRADIAQAIGYCQGLGHPNKYLESRYPELAELSTILTREDKEK